MKLPKKVWIMWGIRLLTANAVLIPVADFYSSQSRWIFPVLTAGNAMEIFLLFCRYKSVRITLCESRLIVAKGILFRRTVQIRLCRTCAIREIRTLLSEKLRLCHLILYCEGASFLLPPADKAFAEQIRNLAEKA